MMIRSSNCQGLANLHPLVLLYSPLCSEKDVLMQACLSPMSIWKISTLVLLREQASNQLIDRILEFSTVPFRCRFAMI